MPGFNKTVLAPASDTKSVRLTEQIEPPNVKTIVFKQIQELFIFFDFSNSEWSHYRGFVLTFQALGIKSSIYHFVFRFQHLPNTIILFFLVCK